MSISLNDSYTYCHQLMRSAARNFYLGMKLLPDPKRRAMFALYGFMRLCDDIADEEDADRKSRRVETARAAQPLTATERRQRLNAWRAEMHNALSGKTTTHPIWPAFVDTVRRHAIPVKIFDDAIDGQLQDLDQTSYSTFDELYRYCYRVASTVGIAAVHIWGFEDKRALLLAERRGIAMQLTNILRDLREDAQRGRRYLPAEDFHRFGLDPNNIEQAVREPAFEEMLRFEAARAQSYYEESAELESLVTADSRPTLQTMTSIYRGILDLISAQPHLVLIQRVRLPSVRKVSLVLRQLWRTQKAAIEGVQ